MVIENSSVSAAPKASSPSAVRAPAALPPRLVRRRWSARAGKDAQPARRPGPRRSAARCRRGGSAAERYGQRAPRQFTAEHRQHASVPDPAASSLPVRSETGVVPCSPDADALDLPLHLEKIERRQRRCLAFRRAHRRPSRATSRRRRCLRQPRSRRSAAAICSSLSARGQAVRGVSVETRRDLPEARGIQRHVNEPAWRVGLVAHGHSDRTEHLALLGDVGGNPGGGFAPRWPGGLPARTARPADGRSGAQRTARDEQRSTSVAATSSASRQGHALACHCAILPFR